MESLKKTVLEKRNVRDSTWKTYERTINELSKALTKNEYKNTNMLKKKKDVEKFLDSKGNAKKRLLLSVILLILSPSKRNDPPTKNKSLYEHYKNLLVNSQADYMNGQREQKKNIKQSENWVDMKDLLKVQKKYGNELRKKGYKQNTKELKNPKDLDLLQKYLLSSIYLLHPPRRLEYSDMKIVTNKEYNALSDTEKKSSLYLVVVSRNKKFFSFGSDAVKSSTVEDVIKIPLDKGLNSVMNLWLNFNDTEYMLMNTSGNKMTQNALGKYLVKVEWKANGKTYFQEDDLFVN
jgi:hypothetical protein